MVKNKDFNIKTDFGIGNMKHVRIDTENLKKDVLISRIVR